MNQCRHPRMSSTIVNIFFFPTRFLHFLLRGNAGSGCKTADGKNNEKIEPKRLYLVPKNKKKSREKKVEKCIKKQGR